MTDDELVEWVAAKIWDEGNVLDQMPALARAIIAKVREETKPILTPDIQEMIDVLSEPDLYSSALLRTTAPEVAKVLRAALTPSETKEGADG